MAVKDLLSDIIERYDVRKWDSFFSIKNRKFKKEVEDTGLDNYGFKNFSNGLKHGTIAFENDELLIASFKAVKNLSERSSKKEQYELAKKILKEDFSLSGGIFIFYDEKGSFRFSLITKKYEKTSKGIKQGFTSFKRYTYFVSKNQTNKTFLSQIAESDFSSLENIISAFSVTKVTKDFYRELSNWYHYSLDKVKFPTDLTGMKDADKSNAIHLIRLITRLIFVWFLKEKDLIPKEIFNEDFLKKTVKDFKKDLNSHYYYNAILQNLFFGTLNRPMNDRRFAKKGDFYENRNEFGVKNLYRNSDFLLISEDEFIKIFQKVPFLNGGLFACLDKDKVYVDGFSRNLKSLAIIPDYLFFSEAINVDLKKYGFKQQEVFKGLIKILQEYNFTIDENSPIDEEVALDPELLGMVFENLLASYNPETQESARKSSGSYYTPREIVNYMVDECLVYHLKENVKSLSENQIRDIVQYSDKDIEISPEIRKEIADCISNLKILDPACGSGAFPMGMLHKLVYILQKIDPDNTIWRDIQIEKAKDESEKAFIEHKDKTEREKILLQINQIFDESINYPDYARKLFLIENCIYGVDIQPIAIQITKLRFFISLVIDQKVDDSKENRGILSLPNLETKFVASNSLIALESNIPPNNPEVTEIERKIKNLRHRYFTVKNSKQKKDIIQEDERLRSNLKDILKKLGFPKNTTDRIAEYNIFDSNTYADWFDPEWMFGVANGFDIVIGNPPYIQLQKAFKDKKKYADLYKDQRYKTFDRTGDIYCLFYEKGMKLLKPKGHLCYITSNKWMRAGYGEKLRNFFTVVSIDQSTSLC